MTKGIRKVSVTRCPIGGPESLLEVDGSVRIYPWGRTLSIEARPESDRSDLYVMSNTSIGVEVGRTHEDRADKIIALALVLGAVTAEEVEHARKQGTLIQ